MPAQNPGAARRLAAYTAPYRYRLAGAVFFMLASSGLNILPPWLFKSVVDDVLISKNLFALNLICVSVILIFVLKAMTLYGREYLMNDVGQRVVMDIGFKWKIFSS